MIALRGKADARELAAPLQRSVWRLVDRATLTAQRRGRAFIVEDGEEPAGGLRPLPDPQRRATDNRAREPGSSCHPSSTTSRGDDVLSISDDGQRIRVLWRHTSRQNSILLTERCNHYCLMCSQPPKTGNDDPLLDEAFELIRLLPRGTEEIGFTGGEPTLYGEGLIDLLRLCRNLHPGGRGPRALQRPAVRRSRVRGLLGG